jgi:hypothetical protein
MRYPEARTRRLINHTELGLSDVLQYKIVQFEKFFDLELLYRSQCMRISTGANVD